MGFYYEKLNFVFGPGQLEIMKLTKPICPEKLITFPRPGQARAECCRPLLPEKILSITRKMNEGW